MKLTRKQYRALKNENHYTRKVLRKAKGAWVGLLIGGVVAGHLAPDYANAERIIIKTEFKDKDKYLADKLVKEEIERAKKIDRELSKINRETVPNTVEDIKKEIKRQADLKLPVYVVQYGDSISSIAKAIDLDPDEIAKLNNFKNEYPPAGEIMTGIIEHADSIELDESKPSSKITSSTFTPVQASPINYLALRQSSSQDYTEQILTSSTEEFPSQASVTTREESSAKEESPTPTKTLAQTGQDVTDYKPYSSQDASVSTFNPTSSTQANPSLSQTHIPPTVEVISEEEINVGRTGEERIEGEVVENLTTTITDSTQTIKGEEYTTTQLVTKEVQEEYEEEYTEEVEKEVIDEEGNTQTITETVTKTRPATRTVTKEVEEEVTQQDDIQVRILVEETLYTITPDTVKQYDNTLAQGEEVIVQEGQDGSYKLRKTTVFHDGVQQSYNEETLERIEPVDRIIRVGSKEIVGKKQSITQTTPIPYQTQYTQTDQLYTDQTQVDQEGVDGKIVESYDITLDKNNNETSRIHTGTDRVEPVSQIIARGTQAIYTSEDQTKTQAIKHDTVVTDVVVHPDEKAEQVTKQEGVDGVRTIVERVYKTRGEETSRIQLTNTVTQEPITQLIDNYIPAERQTDVTYEVEVVSYEVEENASDEVEYGARIKVQDGVDGKRRYEVKTVYYINNDGEKVILDVEKNSVPEEIRQVQNEVWNVGKRIEELGVEGNRRRIKETLPIFYKTQTVKDATFYTDESKITREGIDGEEVTIYEETTDESGKVIDRKLVDKQTTLPVDQVEHIGTKPITTTKVITRTESIPYQKSTKTQIIAPNQPATSKITTPGQDGVRTIREEITYTKGQESQRKELSNTVTKNPVTQITTNYVPAQVHTDTKISYKTIPYDTDYTYDNNLTQGSTRTVQYGRPGRKKIETTSQYYTDNYGSRRDYGTPSVTGYVVTEPQKEVIAIGTAPAQAKYGSVDRVLEVANKYVGVEKEDATHKQLIDSYNQITPLPVGYKVKYSDDWCDAFVSVVAKEAGASDAIGAECGVDRHRKIFEQKGIWKGKVRPQRGDIVIFDWNGNNFSDHIGFVESVDGDYITTIEGNTENALSKSVVGKNKFKWNDYRIQGYARPNYRR